MQKDVAALWQLPCLASLSAHHFMCIMARHVVSRSCNALVRSQQVSCCRNAGSSTAWRKYCLSCKGHSSERIPVDTPTKHIFSAGWGWHGGKLTMQTPTTQIMAHVFVRPMLLLPKMSCWQASSGLTHKLEHLGAVHVLQRRFILIDWLRR